MPKISHYNMEDYVKCSFTKKLMLKEPKKLKFLERIFHFLRDVLDICDRCRYSSSSEPVNYHFLVSLQVVIQMYDGDGEICNSNQKPILYKNFHEDVTAWKVSVFGVILVLIFPRLDWIRKDTPHLSIFSSNVAKYGPE